MTPFAEYLDVFHPRGDTRRITAVLKAYFDESGTDGAQSPVVVVAGFVATGDAWIAADERWRAALLEFGLDHYHAKDCEYGSGPFWKWAGAPEMRRAATLALTEIIRDTGLYGFWAAIPRDDWEAEADSALLARYPEPYFLCFERCLQEVSAWSAQFQQGAPVAIVMSEQNEYEELASRIYRDYIAAKRPLALRSLTFTDMLSCTPCQAADLLAYAANKQFDADVNSAEKRHQIYQVFWDRIGEGQIPVCGAHIGKFALMEIKERLKRGES